MECPSQNSFRALIRSALALVAGLLLAAPALATSVPTVSVTDVGVGTWTPSATTLGCGTPDASGAYTCSGSTSSILSGDATNVSWSMNLNPDPSVSNNFAFTNGTASPQTYIITVVLPISALSAPIKIGGSVGGSITDSNGNAVASLTTAPSIALYTALIDGAPVATGTLYPDPTSFSLLPGNPFGTVTIPGVAFGTPIPSQLLGQGVSSSIGIQLEFTLTPGDSVSFTSVFAVVPEPGTVLLLLAAGAGAVVARRRTAIAS